MARRSEQSSDDDFGPIGEFDLNQVDENPEPLLKLDFGNSFEESKEPVQPSPQFFLNQKAEFSSSSEIR